MVVLISECGCSPVWSCHRNNPVEEGGGDPEGEIYSMLLNVTRYHYLSICVSLFSPSPLLSCPDRPQQLLEEGCRRKERRMRLICSSSPPSSNTLCLCFNVKGFFLDEALMKLNYPNSLKVHYTSFFLIWWKFHTLKNVTSV